MRITRHCLIVGATAALAYGAGCTRPESTTQPSADGVHGDEILLRCAAKYHDARTMVLSGVLRDRRNNISRARRVFLVAQRPDRCRLELDNNVTVVVGRGVWAYRGDEDRFFQSKTAAAVPALSATETACEGIRLFSLDLFIRGDIAMRRPQARVPEYALVGHDYAGRRPCYQFVRRLPGDKGQMRIWIDQDDVTVRRWRLEPNGSDENVRDEECLVDMSVDDLQFDRPLAANIFHISRPKRIGVTR